MIKLGKNKMLAGVCSGFAESANIDPTIMRLLWIFATCASNGWMLFVYVICMMIMPDSE